MQSPLVFIGKIASLALASTLALGSVASLGIAQAATEKPDSDTTELPESSLPDTQVEQAQPVEVAQAINTVLLYDTGEFTVRVFRRGGGGLRKNVFDNARQILLVNEQPATLRTVLGQDAYVSFGVFNGRQVEFASQVFDKPEDPAGGFARLFILQGPSSIAGDTSVIRVEDAELVSIFNVPPGVGQGQSQRDTILFFETPTYSVRVFNRGGQRLMNVFNRFSNVQEVNGTIASLATPVEPFEDTVSYFSSGAQNNQSVRYFARYDLCSRETSLEIYNSNGTRILREGSVGVPENNIPPADFPPGQQCQDPEGSPGRVNDAYVAAVFGGEDTLRRLRELGYEDAYLDSSSRQGDFINAGTFSSEEEATIRVLELQRDGFNSRLVFRDVRFR